MCGIQKSPVSERTAGLLTKLQRLKLAAIWLSGTAGRNKRAMTEDSFDIRYNPVGMTIQDNKTGIIHGGGTAEFAGGYLRPKFRGGKDMVAVNHVIMPPKNLPPDYRDICQVHPRTMSFPVTVQYVTLHPESLKRGYLLLDKDAKDGMVPGRIVGCDMKDSHKN